MVERLPLEQAHELPGRCGARGIRSRSTGEERK